MKVLLAALLAMLLTGAAAPAPDPLDGVPDTRHDELVRAADSEGISLTEKVRRDRLRNQADDLVAFVNENTHLFAAIEQTPGAVDTNRSRENA